MQSVMLLGMAVALLPTLLLFFLDDDRCVWDWILSYIYPNLWL